MNLSVSWPNAKHYLLENPRVELDVDGAFVHATMREGGAKFVLPAGSASPPTATLFVEFTFKGAVVLTLEQRFLLMPPTKFGGGGPILFNYKVTAAGSGDVIVPGQHPLISKQFSALGLCHVMINTNTVDVTNVRQPPLTDNPIFNTLNKILKRSAQQANVRLLARTDGKRPLRWVTATPPSCTSFADTGVLCFLTAPQGHPEDKDDTDFLLDPIKPAFLGAWLGTFLAEGKHDSTLPPRARDHFAPANDPKAHPPNAFPNFVLPRGWEAALMESKRHVALVVPVPSGGSHNTAGTAELPKLLSEVHATLVSSGIILAPNGVAVSRRPMLGLAGHSAAGAALYNAVAASPAAFKEIWLFDTNDMRLNLTRLASSSAANLLIAGFGRLVDAAHLEAKGMASLAGRVRRLPNPEPAKGATPTSIAASSAKLTHALTFAGTVDASSNWTPISLVDPVTGKVVFDERFQVLHQHIIQGDDADCVHFLTKALTSSAFR